MQIKLLKAVLNLFEGGAGAGAGAAAGGEGGTASGESTSAPLTTGLNKGEYANVIFGKQEDAPAAEEAEATEESATPQQSQEDRAKAYKDFIEANKDLYQKDLDDKFAKKTAKRYELENKIKEQQNVIDQMMARYGIQDGDLSKLSAAMDNDNAYYERLADDQGMTVEQVKRLDQLQRQNAQLMRTQQEQIEFERQQAQERQEQQRIQKVIQEAAEVKAMYPNFDLRSELENNQAFRDMIDRGIPPLHAYRMAHFDELQAQAVQSTAAQTEAAVTSNIKAKGKRPLENGTSSQAPFVYKNDVRKFTKADRAEAANRAAHGEIIIL